ncbi:PREDICTED: glutathione S-transferase U10-like [Prunus mume]|uniref:Glutathione S-transferase n=1 Tax=Prunus mume TaxID=102107 RepID=A0ABM0PI62_PRUMU|nr:PREDICTED: glutathione S-transferase U10-like [Prunus mume]
MEEENKVTLHGLWISPYSKRVELALKTKGIPFEFVEEDLMNKSPLLLKYNPVHKKVPVLVHNGKPIVESLVILEYIDETWKTGPRLLPEDPYKRARVRFWASFVDQQVFESLKLAFTSDGEVQEKAIKELLEKLKTFEEGMKEFFPDGIASIERTKNLGLLDIVLYSGFGAHKVPEEVIGTKIIDLEKTPLIFSWLTALNELPLVKELTPPHEKLVAVLQFFRNNALKSGAA